MPVKLLLLLAFLGGVLLNTEFPGNTRQSVPATLDSLDFPRAGAKRLRRVASALVEGYGRRCPCSKFDIPHYTAYKIRSAIDIDGKLDEPAWLDAPRSAAFRDLVSGDSAIHDTRAAVLWDDDFLYVGYWIEEPNLQATLTQRDAPIYQNNDVELFVAGEDAYYEFEINSFGTIYEVLFIWEESYFNKGYSGMALFDRDQPGVRTFNGVGYKNHPRGKRIGYWNWDFEGLRSAVHLEGTINDDSDHDHGWTVELALPWPVMEVLTRDANFSLPPKHQDVWRMDFSRFNQYKAAPPYNDSGGWAWSPHGVWDSHLPECFTYIHFEEGSRKGR